MKKKLLIIDKTQFGYLTDSLKWVQYLKEEFDVTYFSFDTHFPKIDMPGANIKYQVFGGLKLIRSIRFILKCLYYILKSDVIVVEYFISCDLLKKFLPWKKMIVDVRTLSINPDYDFRKGYDSRLKKSCSKFDAIFAISEGVKERLCLPEKSIYILPLGADVISCTKKNFTSLRLLYVGTLSNRHLEDTIKGLSVFVEKNGAGSVTYEIVGSGTKNELQELMRLTNELHIDQIVKFYGRLPYDEIKPFFDKSNVGISYIPITDYYNVQPPTKTFEYVMSGLFVIATATEENKKIVTNENGILINDTAQDFAIGLQKVYDSRFGIDEYKIRKSLLGYGWECIVKGTMSQLLKNVYK